MDSFDSCCYVSGNSTSYFMASVWTIRFQSRQSGEVPSQHFSAACLVMTVPSVSFSRASCSSPDCSCPAAHPQLRQWFQTGLLVAEAGGVTVGLGWRTPEICCSSGGSTDADLDELNPGAGTMQAATEGSLPCLLPLQCDTYFKPTPISRFVYSHRFAQTQSLYSPAPARASNPQPGWHCMKVVLNTAVVHWLDKCQLPGAIPAVYYPEGCLLQCT